MPELPEVETICRDLSKRILGKKITSVAVIKKKLVRNPGAFFGRVLIGSKIIKLERRAKLLVATLERGDYFLLIHLKMTGQLLYQQGHSVSGGGHPHPPPLLPPPPTPSSGRRGINLPNKYSHIIFDFGDGSRLYFNDLRQFGYMKLVSKKEKEEIFSEYGLEPLSKDFTLLALKKLVSSKRTPIKKILIDQKHIAGIGNIYSDEICFQAKVLQTRPGESLSESEIKKLHFACKAILKKAVSERGTTFRDFRDASGARGNFVKYLKVYGRAGLPCLRCKKSIIKKSHLGGRSAAYCPVCQK